MVTCLRAALAAAAALACAAVFRVRLVLRGLGGALDFEDLVALLALVPSAAAVAF